MVGSQEIGELEARKRALLIESEVNRRLLAGEVVEFVSERAWLEKGYALAQHGKKWSPVITPILVMIVFKNRKLWKPVVKGGWRIWRWTSSIRRISRWVREAGL